MRLAIDTSANFCAACIYDLGYSKILATESRDIGRGHAEVLMDVLSCVLTSSDTKYSDISTITVTIGPGSFTGVRVGMAVARGLGLSLDIPVAGVSTLDTCAHFAQGKSDINNVATLIDAKRGEAYYKFSGSEPLVATYEKLEEIIDDSTLNLCGSGASIFNEKTERSHNVIHDLAVAPIEDIAIMKLKVDRLPPEPLYLRNADAKPQAGFVLPHAVEQA